MPAEIDGDRALMARKPAWHRIGHVKEDGWFTANEALAVLNPKNEPIRQVRAFAEVVIDGVAERVETEEFKAVIRKNPDTDRWQILSYMSPDYTVVQLQDQFRFLDEVVGHIDGAHYETAGLLRNGKQAFATIDTGAIQLDVEGRNDKVSRYILGSNSWDGSMAFRVKCTNIRVECANLLACALRGSSNKIVTGDWSTRHTRDIMNRTEAAKATLGLWKSYNDLWFAHAERMIHTDMTDNMFKRVLEGLFVVEDKAGTTQSVDQEAVGAVRTIYELSPTCQNIHGTIWGGLQATTEYMDWATVVRGGQKTSVNESRLRRQLGETDKGAKQNAWDRFCDLANT